MSRIINFEPSLLDSHLIVDVRTPLEFAEDRLPGAINIPLLSNAERVEVGTAYKQQGPQVARSLGLKMACHRFPAMIDQIASNANGRPILVYCWRGGLRSESVMTLLELSGLPVSKLIGGYKSFRNHITGFFSDLKLTQPLVVLHGMTGSGKTEFLLQLPPEKYTVIDLEGAARHRGSAFGAMGLGQQPGQRRFESMLWDLFRKAPADRPILLEGESKRIGKLTLPGNLYEVMLDSTKIWCQVSQETRVKRLAAEYALVEYRQPIREALNRIREKLGGEKYLELQSRLADWDVEGLARGLIESYYDKLYYRVRKWEPDAYINLEDYARAEQELAEHLDVIKTV
jgi:tRNA 2-selenouridine synthase